MASEELNMPQGAPDTGDGEDEGGEEGGGLRLHVSLDEKIAIAREVSTRLFDLLGGHAPAIEVRAEDDQVVVGLADLDAGLCPPGDTRVLESVQFILNKAINRFALKRTRLSVDAEGFRRRRPEGLDKVAQALAQKVLQLGKPIAIGPLGQGDLRFLTAQLSRMAGIMVQTTGVGERRRLVIQPVGLAAAASAAVQGEGEAQAEGEEGEAQGEGQQRRGRRRRRR